MKTSRIDAAEAFSRPSAVMPTESLPSRPALFTGAEDRLGALQRVIDHSPRVVAQRRAIQAAFGGPVQRLAAGQVDEDTAQTGKDGVAQPTARMDHQEVAPLLAPVEGSTHGSVAQAVAAPLVNETGMPNQLKAGIEALSGIDMSTVRVHRNSAKPAQLNALAYAQGSEIHLGPGQERHLPHEAWHVVQQAQGRVKPTFQMKRGVAEGEGVDVNDDAELELEADVMGTKALSVSLDKANQRNAMPARQRQAVQRLPKADVYRGGAELEYRNGQAVMNFQNLPVVEGTTEQDIKDLIRSGIKGISIASIAQGQVLKGEHWALTIETNSGTKLDDQGRIAVALELILGGPKGSTLSELLTAADAASVAVEALAHAGVLNFGAVGNQIRDNAKSKKAKIARGVAVINNAANEPAEVVEGGPLAADWSNLQVSGTWDPQGIAPHLGVWGLQVTIGAPLDELALVGNALGEKGLTDTSVAVPRPSEGGDVTWTARDILLEWKKSAGLESPPVAQSDQDALWKQHYPEEVLDPTDMEQLTRLCDLLVEADSQRKATEAADFHEQVDNHVRQLDEKYAAPSMRTLDGLAKVLAAYARGAAGGLEQGPKHSMKFVTKNPLPSVIAAATHNLPPDLASSLRDACTALVEEKAGHLTYNWVGKALSVKALSVEEWAKGIRERNVDLVAAYDAAYRSAQIGGVNTLNNISAADGESEHTDAPIIEFRDLGQKRPDQMRDVIQSIINKLA